MNVDPGIFKAYDIRGVYPDQLNEDVGFALGRAFATFLKADKVIVGRDMRLSGPQMFDSITRGLMEQGTDVLNVGMVSTDQYYYACAMLDHPGIMVTASHNPPQYSGLKMVRKMPQLLSGNAGIQDLRQIIENDAYAASTGKGSMREVNLSEDFIKKVLSIIDVEGLANLKVIADTGNGMVGPILSRVYEHLPSIELVGMYLEPDGSLPNHGLDPLQEENRAELQARVPAENAAVGFAFDGDGDRFFTIDDRGSFVAGDFMTALMGEYLLEKYPNSKILYDVRASWAVPDLVKQAGGVPLVERVGHAFIKSRMSKEDAVFAGEVSGHYYFKDFFFADSGIVPSLIILEMLSKRQAKLSDMLGELEKKYFISGEINSRIDGKPEDKMKELADRFSDGKVEWLDGVSVTYDKWHFNVRPSNTEPLLRLNLEAMSKELMEEKRDLILDIIRS